MKLLFVLASICVLAFRANVRSHKPVPRLDGRIVGGEYTNIEDLPYQVSLLSNGNHISGGSIIAADRVLTAAHCVYLVSAGQLSVRVGSSIVGQGGFIHQVAEVICNPQYDNENYDYDVAVLRVKEPFPLGQRGIQAIPLADEEPAEGSTCVVSGWGAIWSGGPPSKQLQSTNVNIVGRTQCQQMYDNDTITDRMICASLQKGGSDACQGDSGGPLVSNGVQVGVVSWGSGCANPQYPGVYSNVANLRAWIRANVRSHKPVFRLNGRIVGGEDTNIEDVPYQLSLQYSGLHNCGASIISANWVLTAAHCVFNVPASLLSLRAGSSIQGQGGSVHQVAEVIWHPKYNNFDFGYDIALLKVEEPFPLWQPGIQTIPLTDEEPPEGSVCVVSGWGVLSSDGPFPSQLQSANVPIIGHEQCQELYYTIPITDSMICAGFLEGGTDPCQGDAGGPLVVNGSQCGIVSWGFGCAEPELPGVYANVADQRAWIREISGV